MPLFTPETHALIQQSKTEVESRDQQSNRSIRRSISTAKNRTGVSQILQRFEHVRTSTPNEHVDMMQIIRHATRF